MLNSMVDVTTTIFFYFSIGKLITEDSCCTDHSKVIVPKLLNTVNSKIGEIVTNLQLTKELSDNSSKQLRQNEVVTAVQDGQISQSSNVISNLSSQDVGVEKISTEAVPNIDESRNDYFSNYDNQPQSIHKTRVKRQLLSIPIIKRSHLSRITQSEQYNTSVQGSFKKVITESSVVNGDGPSPAAKKPKL